jgi:uncharacterized membrane protein YhaH (DUF805 family)
MNWYLKVFKQYANFSGRARRKEYWMFFFFDMVFRLALSLLDKRLNLTFGNLLLGVFSLQYFSVTLIPRLAVTTRRLHDIGKSGWWILISLIPFGGIPLLLFLIENSKKEENQYGLNPKQYDEFEESYKYDELAKYEKKDKIKGAAVSLLIASIIWILTIVSNKLLFLYLYPRYESINWYADFYSKFNILEVIIFNLGSIMPVLFLLFAIILLSQSEKIKQHGGLTKTAIIALIILSSYWLFSFISKEILAQLSGKFGIPIFTKINYFLPISLLFYAIVSFRKDNKLAIKKMAIFIMIASALQMINGYMSMKFDYSAWPPETIGAIFSQLDMFIPISFIVLACSFIPEKDAG